MDDFAIAGLEFDRSHVFGLSVRNRDHEIPVNILELGLIYGLNILEGNDVHIKMTLTSPACPVAETLPVDVEQKIKAIPDVNNAKVEITFDPPWDKDMMSEEAKLELGMW